MSNTEFGVRRSARARRARLTLDETGRALVVLPTGAADELAVEMVRRHGAWIERHRRRIVAERARFAARPALGDGRTISLRGVEHLVVVQPAEARRRSTVSAGDGIQPVLAVAVAGTVSPATLLERWLRAEARSDLASAVAGRSAEMGVTAGRLSVRDQRTRWGSASRSGGLSFSWRLVLCPPEVLDYVVVHELAHLRWAGHGPRFWDLVRRHVARADEHRRWLRANHRAVRAALD